MDAVLKRLEEATLRLERIASSASTETTAPAKIDDSCIAPFIAAFPNKEEAAALSALLTKHFANIPVLNSYATPSQQQLPLLVNFQSLKIFSLKDSLSKQDPLFNLYSLVAEGLPALGWIASLKPVPFIADFKEAAMFYANRVFKDSKKDDAVYICAKAFIAVLDELSKLVKEHHLTGVRWKPNGKNIDELINTSVSLSTASVATTPASVPSTSAAAVTPIAAPTNVSASAPKAAFQVPKAKKDPKTSLAANRWTVENHVNNQAITLADTQIKQTVYVYNCQDSVVQVEGKVTAVSIDNCNKVGVVVSSVVGTIELVNSKGCKIQVLQKVPTILVDKCDNIQIYLSKDSIAEDVQVMTAKSSSVNVLVEKEDGDYVEMFVNEMIRTTIGKSKFLSEVVEHKG